MLNNTSLNNTFKQQTQQHTKFGSAAAAKVAKEAGSYQVSGLVKKAAHISDKAFSFTNNIASPDKLKESNFVTSRLRKIGKMLFDYDYREVHEIGLFNKFKAKIVEPPIGALIMLLYPFTIGPRLGRAKQRDPSGVEFMDVIRRDMTAITIFLFLLKPLTNALNTVKEKRDGLKLVSKDGLPKSKGGSLIGKILSYRQFDDFYQLSSANQIEAIVAEGNHKALDKAVQRAMKNYNEVFDKFKGEVGEKEAREALKGLRETIADMATEKNKLIKADKQLSSNRLKTLAEKAFDQMVTMKSEYAKFDDAVGKTNAGKGAIGKMVNALADIDNVLCKYAKGKRLPVDILAFAVVVGAIGWFPVWFNDVLSQNRRNKEAAQKRAAEAANMDTGKVWAALQQARQQAQTQRTTF